MASGSSEYTPYPGDNSLLWLIWAKLSHSDDHREEVKVKSGRALQNGQMNKSCLMLMSRLVHIGAFPLPPLSSSTSSELNSTAARLAVDLLLCWIECFAREMWFGDQESSSEHPKCQFCCLCFIFALLFTVFNNLFKYLKMFYINKFVIAFSYGGRSMLNIKCNNSTIITY